MVARASSAGSLTIRQLQIFLVASRSASFSSAAEKLGISQPSLSASIARLEQQLGVSVFDRSTRHMKLTREGGRLAIAAADLVHIYQSTIRNIHNQADPVARIRFAMVPALNGGVAPAAIAQFRRQHPQYEVSLHDVSTEDAISMVQAAFVEFAVLSNAPRLVGMKQEIIGQTRIDVIASSQTDLGRQTSVTWDQLTELPLILAGSIKRRGHLQALWEEAGYELRPAYEVNDIVTAVSLAADGLGYVLLSNIYLPRPLNPRLAAVRLESASMPRPLHAVYLEGRDLPAPTLELIACIKAQLLAANQQGDAESEGS